MAASPLEGAKRNLPGLPREDYQDNGMAQPSHSLEI
jgi:hypothetical protein